MGWVGAASPEDRLCCTAPSAAAPPPLTPKTHSQGWAGEGGHGDRAGAGAEEGVKMRMGLSQDLGLGLV